MPRPDEHDSPPPALNYYNPRPDDEVGETWGDFWRALGLVLLFFFLLLFGYAMAMNGLAGLLGG